MKKIIFTIIFSLFILTAFSLDKNFSTLTEEAISYEEITRGDSIVFVWASWCPSCRRQLDDLSQKAPFLEDIDLFFINLGEKSSVVKSFAKARNLNSQIQEKIVLDQEAFFANKFSIVAIPTFIFFKDGQAVRKSYFFDPQLLEDIYGDN